MEFDFSFTMLGPTYATNKILKQLNLTMDDMGVIEFHEAFAGQVLANMTAMGSTAFAKQSLGQDDAVGQMDMSRVNPLGGSLAVGHPFGATGTRLVTTAANRLQREGQRYALLTACADGGLATACVLENYAK